MSFNPTEITLLRALLADNTVANTLQELYKSWNDNFDIAGDNADRLVTLLHEKMQPLREGWRPPFLKASDYDTFINKTVQHFKDFFVDNPITITITDVPRAFLVYCEDDITSPSSLQSHFPEREPFTIMDFFGDDFVLESIVNYAIAQSDYSLSDNDLLHLKQQMAINIRSFCIEKKIPSTDYVAWENLALDAALDLGARKAMNEEYGKKELKAALASQNLEKIRELLQDLYQSPVENHPFDWFNPNNER